MLQWTSMTVKMVTLCEKDFCDILLYVLRDILLYVLRDILLYVLHICILPV